ncbi:interferon-induced GTP-binding Mx-like protein [Labeo rohita]|uniref:Interferon-induced GTP-binding Mx-like protein n=1 Tax=Labeo rohita TaxID=84645 RepID=A0A498M3X5_LABRO|nr:interferon-induced GTP-binding Mx-like protein [Labeo rohita]
MSPDVCDLTLIDLPGIARVPVEGQPEDIGKQIKRLIKKYIIKHETVNLVVVPCNIDIATTEALQMAQEVDPDGIRTIAILTKPDLIDKGTEKRILKIVHNKVIPLSKGPKGKCGLPKPCPGNDYSFKVSSGATNIVGPRICFEGKILNDEARTLIADLGSAYISQLKFRDNWVFVGGKKTMAQISFEQHMKNERETNKYDSWPEMIEMEGCIPQMF